MRRGFGPGLSRPDAAVLTEIRASPANEEPGPKTQAATARLLSQAARPRHASLEFVRGDDPGQFRDDAKALLNLLEAVESV